jgi:putative transposase
MFLSFTGYSMDLYNREIISYSISLSPNLEQIKEMLNGLFERLPDGATPIFHSDQGWQYQHSEYQRLLKEHNIIQSMSRKGNCMDNGAMENFFGRLKVEMFYGEKFRTVDEFVHCLEEYISYYNSERISLKLKGMSPVQYRTHSQVI